jgi:hypothetical protein
MLCLLVAMLCADMNPPQTYQIDTCICRGDPLGSRAEGTLKYLAEPRVVTLPGRKAILLAGRAATLPLGLDMSKEPGLRIELLPQHGPFGTVLLDVDARVQDDAPGGATVEHAYRATRLVVPGQRIRFRVAAESPSNQTWAEVVVTRYEAAESKGGTRHGTSAEKRGAEAAEADIKAGCPTIRVYGKRRISARGLGEGDTGMVDTETGLPIKGVAGCLASDELVAEADAYNQVIRAWHAKQKK